MTKRKTPEQPGEGQPGAPVAPATTPEATPVPAIAAAVAAPTPPAAGRPTPAPPTPNVSQQNLARRDDTMAVAFQGLVPSSLGEAMQLSAYLAKSGAIPVSLRGQPESVFTIIIAGMEIGLTPIRALQSISNIKGNLAMKADLQLALVRRSGALDYFDEGFEFKGKTDRNLKDRAAQAKLILALVQAQDIPDGKPYGWATMRRKGERQEHTRVFTWADAERFIYNAKDDEDGGGQGSGQRVEKKLSEKSNYKNTPQDMYPKRARVRVMQVCFSDVLAGMPAIEALEGTVLDAEVVSRESGDPHSTEDAIAARLDVIRGTDSVTATSIAAGFEQLQLGLARRLQKLTEYQANPTGLLEWMKTEYANRNSKAGRARPNVLDAIPAGSAPETKTVDPGAKSAVTESQIKRAGANPEPQTAKPVNFSPPGQSGPVEALKAIAERFKGTIGTGTF